MKLGKLDLSALAVQREHAVQYCELANHHATLVNQVIRAILTDLYSDGWEPKQLRQALINAGMPRIAAHKVIRSVFGAYARNGKASGTEQMNLFPAREA